MAEEKNLRQEDVAKFEKLMGALGRYVAKLEREDKKNSTGEEAGYNGQLTQARVDYGDLEMYMASVRAHCGNGYKMSNDETQKLLDKMATRMNRHVLAPFNMSSQNPDSPAWARMAELNRINTSVNDAMKDVVGVLARCGVNIREYPRLQQLECTRPGPTP